MFQLALTRYAMVLCCLVLCTVSSPLSAQADPVTALSSGETLYVPVYSNVYAGPQAVPHQLATMLSIHNIDPKNTITILTADYYDSNGKFIEGYIKKPVVLKPFNHTFIYLKEYDKRGGPGANFIVKWSAEKNVNQPIVEALMYGTRAGISFTSPGQIIRQHAE
jgi:hypothetical protein